MCEKQRWAPRLCRWRMVRPEPPIESRGQRTGILRRVAAALTLASAELVWATSALGRVEAAGPPFRVVIDAGHGGKDPGALSPLLPLAEKDVALDVALRLGAALQRRGVQVVHTRTSDQYVALAERAAAGGRWRVLRVSARVRCVMWHER